MIFSIPKVINIIHRVIHSRRTPLYKGFGMDFHSLCKAVFRVIHRFPADFGRLFPKINTLCRITGC